MSKLGPLLHTWRNFFKTMVDDGLYVPGNGFHENTIRKCFLHLINDSLKQFQVYWNTHKIRQSSDSAGGIPDVMFYVRRNCGYSPSVQKMGVANDACLNVNDSITGDQDIDEYFDYVMEELNLAVPESKADASAHYDILLRAASF